MHIHQASLSRKLPADITLVLMAAGSSSRFVEGLAADHAIKKQWLRVDCCVTLWLLVVSWAYRYCFVV